MAGGSAARAAVASASEMRTRLGRTFYDYREAAGCGNATIAGNSAQMKRSTHLPRHAERTSGRLIVRNFTRILYPNSP